MAKQLTQQEWQEFEKYLRQADHHEIYKLHMAQARDARKMFKGDAEMQAKIDVIEAKIKETYQLACKGDSIMKYSLYNEAQWFMEEEFGEHDWAGNGPMVDAMGEASLEDALYHILGCCSAVLDGADDGSWPEWQEPDGDAYDETQDQALLEAFDQYIEYSNPRHAWRKEIKKYLFMIELGLEAA